MKKISKKQVHEVINAIQNVEIERKRLAEMNKELLQLKKQLSALKRKSVRVDGDVKLVIQEQISQLKEQLTQLQGEINNASAIIHDYYD